MRNTRLAAVVLFAVLTGPLSLQAAPDDHMGSGVGDQIQHASVLAQSGKYAEALKIIDELRAKPGKTSDENSAIKQLRAYVVAQMQPHPAQ